MDFTLVIPAFIAGFLMFLAPCTLPLIPAYLGFISGVSLSDLKDPLKKRNAEDKIFVNGLLYVTGFSIIFILLGTVFAAGGLVVREYREMLAKIGGVFIILFGLSMMEILKFPFLGNFSQAALPVARFVRPGNPTSSLVFGATFALGWTPCVGPILGTIFTLAATSATAGRGAFLLGVFSLGLAIPFLIIAAGVGSASEYLKRFSPYLTLVSYIGGLLLVLLGILIVTENLAYWISYVYRVFDFIHYERLLDYL